MLFGVCVADDLFQSSPVQSSLAIVDGLIGPYLSKPHCIFLHQMLEVYLFTMGGGRYTEYVLNLARLRIHDGVILGNLFGM